MCLPAFVLCMYASECNRCSSRAHKITCTCVHTYVHKHLFSVLIYQGRAYALYSTLVYVVLVILSRNPGRRLTQNLEALLDLKLPRPETTQQEVITHIVILAEPCGVNIMIDAWCIYHSSVETCIDLAGFWWRVWNMLCTPFGGTGS